MKKLLVLIVALVMVVSTAAVSMAAVDIGGNLRVRFESTKNDNYFSFDRLALSIGGDLSDNNGFKSELQVRDVNQVADFRLDHAYYYQKNLFTTDELHVGFLPLDWHADKSVTIKGSLGGDIKPGNSLGLKYGVKAGAYSLTAYVVNAANGNRGRDNNPTTGYDLGVRGTISPIDGLTVGLGVVQDVVNKDAKDSNLDLVVDAVYAWGDLGLYTEFISQKKTIGGKDGGNETGFYFEGTYALTEKLLAYAGMASGKDLGKDDRIVAGARYKIAPATALQGEIVNCDDVNNITLRLRVDF
ncbi:MAG TPA: hypothetical protein VIL66_05310 [Bacillota bacterium]